MKSTTHLGPWGWTARIWSLLTIAFCLLFFFGEGAMSELIALTAGEWLGFGCMGLILLGMVAGWWRESLGALLAIGGLLAFYLVDIIRSGNPPSGIWFLLLAVPGFIWFFRWRKALRLQNVA